MSTLRSLMQAVGARCLDGRLPDTYLVVDVETSGLPGSINPNSTPACVVQYGITVVRSRQICTREAYLVKRPPGSMQKRASEINGITDALLAADGELPELFYPRLISLLQVFRRDRCSFIGHNMAAFDAPFVNTDIARHDFDFAFKPDEVIDTGMIYKASQRCVAPRGDETLGGFFKRVSSIRSRVKWNLLLTMDKLHLREKFNLDPANAHDASYDCYMTYLLFEELRQLAEGAPSGY